MAFVRISAALLAVTLSGSAIAQQSLPDVRVAYGDLDLASPDGVATLDHRLNAAIHAACPDYSNAADLTAIRAARTCRAAKGQEIASARDLALAGAAHTRTASLAQ